MSKLREPSPSPSLKKGGEQIAPVASAKPKKKYRTSQKTKKARRLRNDATGAEKFLWTKLNRKQIDGHKFRRQHPIGPYVLDFYCVELKLCIELDGDQHGLDENRRKDEHRTKYLEKQGILVIRYWNCDVFDNFDAIVDAIYYEATMRSKELEIMHGGVPSPFQGSKEFF